MTSLFEEANEGEGVELTLREVKIGLLDSELGTIAVGLSGQKVCWLSFADGEPEVERAEISRRLKREVVWGEDEEFKFVAQQIDEYFDGDRVVFDLELELNGTEFQNLVWNTLREIPYGQSLTYSGLAAKIGIKNGQRAVGKANGDNPISLIIPCHRVIRADGDLCGYAWGLWRKQRLLGLESGQPGLF